MLSLGIIMTSLPLVTHHRDEIRRRTIYNNKNVSRRKFNTQLFVDGRERTIFMSTIFFILLFVVGFCDAAEYSNQWTVEIRGGDLEAEKVATELGYRNKGRLFQYDNIFMLWHRSVMKRSLRPSTDHHFRLLSHKSVISAEQQIIIKRVKRDVDFDVKTGPKDPLWSKSWYLQPQITPSMRVTEAWAEGYTGKGVIVTILDDGIEYSHPDLAANYDKLASKDINDGDDDPKPRATYNNENRHGTRCAGEVSAVANNNVCSVGIAFESSIGGVRMLDGQVTDMVEGASIGLRPEHIDIYSASWGPDDDGRTVDGPAKRAKQAFEKGVTTGRNGKGSIFVWASGNGGKKDDNCNCDGYTNSIYTLSISSTTEHTNLPWYSEDCSSTLATTYSSGVSSEKQIVTTDLSGRCTTSHTGTSASAPLAAGICALALEANPALTWRDMQHIVVRTANPDGLKAEDWAVNAVGRKVSHSYGYGLMDAHAMVLLAKKWKTVPTQRKCNITVLRPPSVSIFSKGSRLKVPFKVSSCDGVMPERLEHVQAEISANCNKRGGMYIYLTSPSGTKSTLLDQRSLDIRSAGFTKWPFMTTHNWDENPKGEWILEINTDGRIGGTGSLTYFNLVLYGTLDNEWPATSSPSTETTETSSTAKTMYATSTTSTTTKMITTVISDTTVNQSTDEPGNCKTPTESGKACLVCEDGYLRSPDMLHCLHECPQGHFASMEKVVGEKVPRTNNNEKDWESQQDERFEEEERFDGARICVLCVLSPYCTACNGPKINDCSACMSGSHLVEGQCTVEQVGIPTLRRTVYSLTIVVCILSVIIFIFLFILLQCCRSHKRSNSPLYRYVPNSQDGDGINESYHNSSENGNGAGHKNGGFRNSPSHDVKKGLLEYSDDERT